MPRPSAGPLPQSRAARSESAWVAGQRRHTSGSATPSSSSRVRAGSRGRCAQSSIGSGSIRRPNALASVSDMNGPASVQPRSSWVAAVRPAVGGAPVPRTRLGTGRRAPHCPSPPSISVTVRVGASSSGVLIDTRGGTGDSIDLPWDGRTLRSPACAVGGGDLVAGGDIRIVVAGGPVPCGPDRQDPRCSGQRRGDTDSGPARRG